MGIPRAWPLVVSCVLALGACVHRAGNRVVTGAISGFQEHVDTAAELQEKTIVEHAASSAVRSATRQLTNLGRPMTGYEGIPSTAVGGSGGMPTPIEAMSDQAAHALARSLSQELVLQFGPNGEGPLGTSLAASAERISASAANAAKTELRGLLTGAIPLGIAFVLGLLLALAIVWIWSLWRRVRMISRRMQA